MRVGIIGGGVVGSATAAAWRGFADEVRVYDADPFRDKNGLDATMRCDVVFVCLPEGAVDDFCNMVGGSTPKTNLVLKSTVPVGTTRRLAERYGLPNLVHSPEFLTARTAEHDAANPRLNVIGVPQSYKEQGIDILTGNDCGYRLRRSYEERWPDVEVLDLTSDASELMKLAMNSFFAAKVSYWNEVESYCRAAGVDYETVRAACAAEGRVGDLHTHVPGPDGKRGFGGTCLPKDLKQLLRCFTEAGVAAPVMVAVQARNDRLDRPEGE